MTYEEFLEESLSKGLLRRQKSDLRAVFREIWGDVLAIGLIRKGDRYEIE
jgi:hypothetical protein